MFPLDIQHIPLPDGPFAIYMPIPKKVSEVFQALQQHQTDTSFPYWARLWPSAIALAGYLQKNTHLIQAKWVAELASGIGLPSLVAAGYAQKVWCSDLVAEAMEVVAKSAAHYQLENITAVACNWEHLPAALKPDVLLMSDVNYDPAAFASLEKVFQYFLEMGTTILLASPQRLMARPFIEKLLPFVVEQSVEEVTIDHQPATISIFVLRK
jgi:predicted nicotinamide N-methyase